MKVRFDGLLRLRWCRCCSCALDIPKRVFILSLDGWEFWQVVEYRNDCPSAGNALMQIVTVKDGY